MNLEKAIRIAALAHEGQWDKGGHPYILHPLRVMLAMSTEEERIVAILHDVVEDSQTTLEDLRREGFSDEVIKAIACLTRRADESYPEFILRLRPNEIARAVKIADIQDNKDLSRIAAPTKTDYERIRKYDEALLLLRKEGVG